MSTGGNKLPSSCDTSGCPMPEPTDRPLNESANQASPAGACAASSDIACAAAWATISASKALRHARALTTSYSAPAAMRASSSPAAETATTTTRAASRRRCSGATTCSTKRRLSDTSATSTRCVPCSARSASCFSEPGTARFTFCRTSSSATSHSRSRRTSCLFRRARSRRKSAKDTAPPPKYPASSAPSGLSAPIASAMDVAPTRDSVSKPKRRMRIGSLWFAFE
mmetsp:Transcript_32548/g.112577  ORF Transcript_32548/g.112577 Transcript_32548/m.112577 type:complete len:226 (+) Transcript_32548:472-1149(+)